MSKYFKIIFTAFNIALTASRSTAQTDPEKVPADKIFKEIESGKIAFKLTEASEVIELLGNPEDENTFPDGGMLIRQMKYPGVEVILGKFKQDEKAPFTLLALNVNGQPVDMGRNKKLVLRGNQDLPKLDHFSGFQNVSLVNVDLKNEMELVQNMSYDNLTEWPSKEKLPPDFNPTGILENHKTPGLGIRKLHSQGITGKGVGIAIIDQPLLLGHQEYASQIIRYDATGLLEYPPQMHGSPVASIAVGQNVGVAPEAALSYFAVPMWERTNSIYIKTFETIFQLNESLPVQERIRVVSISDGGFSSNSDYAGWLNSMKKAGEKGIFVATCDPDVLNLGTLKTASGRDPDDPGNYTAGKYSSDKNVLLIPSGNRTLASHLGNDVYAFHREEGMSWAAPYIAGLAALAFQCSPDISPAEIRKSMTETATMTAAGPIINPTAFMEKIKNDQTNRIHP